MKKSFKALILSLGLVALVSCTKSFCSNSDKANIMNSYATTIVDKENNTTREQKIINDLKTNGTVIPSDSYFDYLENKIYEFAITDDSIKNESFVSEGKTKLANYTIADLKDIQGNDGIHKENVSFELTTYYSNIKFAGPGTKTYKVSETMWSNFDKWNNEAREKAFKNEEIVVGNENIGKIIYDFTLDDLPSSQFLTSYKKQIESAVTNNSTCITPSTGIYGDTILEGKSWGDAFNKGLIEGLIEYPIAWMLHSFYNAFNGGAVAAIMSILVVTIIVRLFLLAVTFRSTVSQTRMQEMQPELSKLQAKYPNANTNQYEKQQMAQEQMQLYKKYKVNPFSMFIVLIVQFPIFIAVWGAMSGSAVLRLDTIFANGGRLWSLSLSSLMNTEILSGNISAIILFVVMSAVQILSAKLPTWLQQKDAKKYATKLGKNPTVDQNNKQMKMVSNVMIIMIIFMGFTLPVAMAFYWVISALISLAQSMIMRKISNKKKGFAKYKTK